MGFFDAMGKSLATDWYILVAFVITLVILVFTIRYTYRLYQLLNPSERMANPQEEKKYPKTLSEIKEFENKVLRQRTVMNLFYSLFANAVSIFPLLGMFGTVKALIGFAGENSAEMELFFQALTSTAWGIIFAVLFKIADAVISVPVAANHKEVDTLLERNSSKKEKEQEKMDEAQRNHS